MYINVYTYIHIFIYLHIFQYTLTNVNNLLNLNNNLLLCFCVGGYKNNSVTTSESFLSEFFSRHGNKTV